MKHLSKLLAALLVAGALVACGGNFTNKKTPLDTNGNIQFPDTKFAAYMVEHFDTNRDGGISPKEAATITEIKCPGMEIESLVGIEYCTELTHLDCEVNLLTTLDVSKNTELTYLSCRDNRLMTSLDVSKNTELTYLSCYNNPLTDLDVSKNTKLNTLWCDNNQLTTLDVSNNTELTNLYCSDNQLNTLNISKNTELIHLECDDNQLTALDVSMTKLNKYGSTSNVLHCKMASLKTLWLKTGWELKGINKNRSTSYIHPNTKIEYKD